MRMTRRVPTLTLFQTRSNITCSRSGTMKAAAHKMAQRYKITANSSVQGKGLLKTKRAVICTKKVTKRQMKTRPPNVSAAFLNQRIFSGCC